MDEGLHAEVHSMNYLLTHARGLTHCHGVEMQPDNYAFCDRKSGQLMPDHS